MAQRHFASIPKTEKVRPGEFLMPFPSKDANAIFISIKLSEMVAYSSADIIFMRVGEYLLFIFCFPDLDATVS
jgi:hypothetical protein